MKNYDNHNSQAITCQCQSTSSVIDTQRKSTALPLFAENENMGLQFNQ